MSVADMATVSGEMVESGVDYSDEILSLEFDRLSDHPANPPERIEAQAILPLVKSIEEFGQREAVRVRLFGMEQGTGRNHYQILSGHRRAAACRMANLPVRCEVVDCSDAEALREVLLGNAERQDLNPIQRAELMRSMIGAGIDRAEAGALFGLESDSGVKNTLRLLELPASMRAMVAEGLLPARVARYVIPFAAAEVIVDGWAKQLRENDRQRMFASENPKSFFTVDMDDNHRVHARPVDGRTKYRPSWQHKKTGRKFELDDKTREQLKIVQLPIGPKGKLVEVAQNVALFDKLNEPFLVADTTYGGGTKPKKPAAEKKLTPAQAAAEKRAKAAEAKKRLKEGIAKWQTRFTRCLIARQTEPGHPVIAATLPWMVGAECDSEWLNVACASLGAPVRNCVGHARAADVVASAIATCDSGEEAALADRLWRIMMWPQYFDWPVGPTAESYRVDAPEIDLTRLSEGAPKKLTLECWNVGGLDEPLSMIVAFAGVNYSAGWNAAVDPGPERDLMIEYLGLHASDQIDALAKKWNVNIGGAKTKSAKVKLIAADHSVKKPLPLPDGLVGKTTGTNRKGRS